MYNISQFINNNLLNSIFSNFYSYISNLANPFNLRYSVFNYADLTETLNDSIRTFALHLLKEAIETIDSQWRNRPDRVSRYYVKQTRTRTIITLFGELTYTRTIYIDRHTNQSYCHVDTLLGLSCGIKYDPCVRAKAAELYSFHNSMIKVGRILGDQIFCNFSTTKQAKDYAIPRQSIQRFLLEFGCIKTSFAKKKHTPKILYIMADEKWISTQEHTVDEKTKKLMNRAVVIFEDCENEYQNSSLGRKQRHRLTNKTRIFGTASDIWERVEDALSQLYDINEVEEIHIMGDGALWIKGGVNELTNSNYKVDFTLDSFHLNQTLLRIENNEEIRKLLWETIYIEKDKKLFKDLCSALKTDNPNRDESIEKNMKYILNNWKAIMKRVDEISMPCAMEGAISHDICNPFTSVPKAYMPNNFEVYNQNRMHFLNGAHMLHLFLSAFDKKEDDTMEVDLTESYFYSSTSSSSSYKQPYFLKPLSDLQNTLHFI